MFRCNQRVVLLVEKWIFRSRLLCSYIRGPLVFRLKTNKGHMKFDEDAAIDSCSASGDD